MPYLLRHLCNLTVAGDQVHVQQQAQGRNCKDVTTLSCSSAVWQMAFEDSGGLEPQGTLLLQAQLQRCIFHGTRELDGVLSSQLLFMSPCFRVHEWG